MISIYPFIFLFIYTIKPKIRIHTILFLIATIIIINIYNTIDIFNYITKEKKTNYNIYKYIAVDNSSKKKLYKITNYINMQKKEVYILNEEAIFYALTTNKYHKYFDIPLPGNIGKNGEKEMIKILKMNDNILLIKNISTIKKDFPKLYIYIYKNYKKTKSNEINNIFNIYTK